MKIKPIYLLLAGAGLYLWWKSKQPVALPVNSSAMISGLPYDPITFKPSSVSYRYNPNS